MGIVKRKYTEDDMKSVISKMTGPFLPYSIVFLTEAETFAWRDYMSMIKKVKYC